MAALGSAIQGQHIPHCATTGLRVWGQNFKVWLSEICPILNIFWVAFAHSKSDNRCADHPAIRFTAPVVGDEPGFLNTDDIRFKRQGDHIRLEAFDDRAGLRAGALVGLFKSYRLTGLFLPVCLE